MTSSVLLLAASAVAPCVLCSSAAGQSLQFLGNDPNGPDLVIEQLGLRNGLYAAHSLENPILSGINIYAPDFIRNGTWNCYFGGWLNPGDGNDRIYLTVCDDFAPEGPWDPPVVVVDHGEYVHVNDPSVRKIAPDLWVMAYTAFKFVNGQPRDWIAVSISADGGTWSPSSASAATEVAIANMSFTDIARPAILPVGDRVKMWFDGRTPTSYHSYLAESYPANPLLFYVIHQYPDTSTGRPGFFEPDVELVQSGGTLQYIAVTNPDFASVEKLVSTDGVNFQSLGTTAHASDPVFGRQQINNPSLVYDNFDPTSDGIRGIAYGMGSLALTDNDIGFAYFKHRVHVLSCPSNWHIHQTGRYFDQASVETYAYNTYCRIKVFHGVTGATLVDQVVSSVRGDRWQFVP